MSKIILDQCNVKYIGVALDYQGTEVGVCSLNQGAISDITITLERNLGCDTPEIPVRVIRYGISFQDAKSIVQALGKIRLNQRR